MRSIQVLDLSYNALNTFPFSVLHMPLKELHISFNEVRATHAAATFNSPINTVTQLTICFVLFCHSMNTMIFT